jgi:predicted Zn-dependent protease with MMP-like domain
LRELRIESPFDLMGLYQGIPLTQQSTFDVRHQPDIIFLYRRAILDYWCEGTDDLRAVVRHVLIHEIGHHFGFSDDDMERIERAAGKPDPRTRDCTRHGLAGRRARHYHDGRC